MSGVIRAGIFSNVFTMWEIKVKAGLPGFLYTDKS